MLEPLAAVPLLSTALARALPPATPALSVRAVEGLRVLSLRHLAGGAPALEAALAAHGLAALPLPGRCEGVDPWQVWAGPTESLLITSQRTLADGVLQALAPGRTPLACAVDQATACRVLELTGPGLVDLLPRLVDASAIPHQPGQGGRVRWIDISVQLLRLQAERALLLVDRSQALYAAQWLAYAQAATAAPS